MWIKPKYKTGIRKKVIFLIYSVIALNAILGVSLGYYLGFNLLRDTIEENRRQAAQILASYISHIIDDEIKIIGGDKVTIDNANLRASLTHFKIGKTGHAILIDKNTKETVYKKNQFVICEKIENAFLSEKGFDWEICVTQGASEAFVPLNMLFLQMIIVLGAVTAFPIVLVFFAAGAFIKPIIKFRKEIEKMGREGLGYKIDIKTGDEIEELVDSFNEMAETLQKTLVKRASLVKEVAEHQKAEAALKKTCGVLKETQAQFIQAEKLTSIGQLVAGVAHEINNPLSAILGEAEMLLMDKTKDKEVRDASKTIVEQAKRIKVINERLLVFSRKEEIKLEPLDINKTLKKAIALIAHHAEMADVEIREEIGVSLPSMLGDNNQLEEVFLNIMLNAVQAMENEKKKKLAVKTSMIEKTVIIEFEDTGKGMDEETIKRIYDPFFTTKENHAGLGLSLCYGIIKSHKGDIGVYSEIGKGSTFTVRLPAIRKEER